MTATLIEERAPVATLPALTAADLMTPNPISLRDDATVPEAIALLTDKGFSAAPVIDEAGRPVGVLSRTDLLVHDRERSDYLRRAPEYYERTDVHLRTGEPLPNTGWEVVDVDRTRVREVMTPCVFSVPLDAPLRRVAGDMVALKVHRLFVVDTAGVLVGVISALDLLRRLRT